MPPVTRRRVRRKLKPDEEPVRNHAAEHDRLAFTCCTSTWADGTAGPLAMSFKHGACPVSLAERVNSSWKGLYRIMFSGADSHMFTAESTLEMFETLFTDAFRIKRTDLGYTSVRDAPGMLIADAFTGVLCPDKAHR